MRLLMAGLSALLTACGATRESLGSIAVPGAAFGAEIVMENSSTAPCWIEVRSNAGNPELTSLDVVAFRDIDHDGVLGEEDRFLAHSFIMTTAPSTRLGTCVDCREFSRMPSVLLSLKLGTMNGMVSRVWNPRSRLWM